MICSLQCHKWREMTDHYFKRANQMCVVKECGILIRRRHKQVVDILNSAPKRRTGKVKAGCIVCIEAQRRDKYFSSTQRPLRSLGAETWDATRSIGPAWHHANPTNGILTAVLKGALNHKRVRYAPKQDSPFEIAHKQTGFCRPRRWLD